LPDENFNKSQTVLKIGQKQVKPIVLLQPLWWCCVDCVIHHERDVREEQKYMYVTRTSDFRSQQFKGQKKPNIRDFRSQQFKGQKEPNILVLLSLCYKETSRLQ